MTQDVELVGKRGRRRLSVDFDRRERVRLRGRTVLERHVAGLLEQHVDDHALGGSEDDRVDELLALVAAAVPAHELHSRARQRDVEDARVRGVGQVEADDLADLCVQGKIGLAADEQDVAETAHRGVRRLGAAERRDLPVLDEDVVERQEQLAMCGRPVVRVRRDDEDVPVEAQLLPVVLPNVRVVPVDPRSGNSMRYENDPPTGIGACVSCVPS